MMKKNYTIILCMLLIAINSCKPEDPIYGCTDPGAINYDAQANTQCDDHCCVYTFDHSEPDEEEDNNNYLCEGIPNNNSYLALNLEIGASYSMMVIDNNNNYVSVNYSVTGSTEINGNTYIKTEYSDLNGQTKTDYYRRASNGTIFNYIEDLDAEAVYISANPQQGEEYQVPSANGITYLRNIEHTNRTLTLSNGCTYEGLIEVGLYQDNTDENDNLSHYFYYKNGLGLVAIKEASGNFTHYINEVTP